VLAALLFLPQVRLGFAEDSRALTPPDFAYSRNLSSEEGASLIAAELPEEIYQSTVREDLGDLRVFNAQGGVVPHEIRPAAVVTENSIRLATVAFFPIQGAASPGEDTGNAIQVSEDASGRVVSVQFSGAAPKSDSTADSRGSWYLLDLRGSTQPVQALVLQASGLQINQIVPVGIEASDDLQKWSRIQSSGVLARLEHQGQVIERSRIEFSSQKAKFLRVRVGGAEPVTLAGVSVEIVTSDVRSTPMRWSSFQGTKGDEAARTILFDSASHLPALALKVRLPVLNTMLQVRIESRADDTRPWVRRFSGSVYRLGAAGGEIESPEVEFGSIVKDRFWRIEVQGRDSSFGETLPALSLGWRPGRVLFLAQGAGPFRLLYGSADVSAPDFGIGSLLNTTGTSAVIAEVGSRVESGGATRLVQTPVVAEIPWKKWLLWGVLVAFVIMVAAMARSLWRDLQKE
jgi:hypothetical protein